MNIMRTSNSFKIQPIHILLGFLALAAFTLSFNTLLKLAEYGGLDYPVSLFGYSFTLAFLFPLTIDAVIVAASIVSYTDAAKGCSNRVPRITVFLFTVLSILFNIWQSQLQGNLDTVGGVVHAMAPISLFVVFELLFMRSIHFDMERGGVSATLATLRGQAEAMRNEFEGKRAALQAEIESLQDAANLATGTLEGLEKKIAAKRAAVKEAGKSESQAGADVTRAKIKLLAETGKYNSIKALGSAAGVTSKTASTHLDALGIKGAFLAGEYAAPEPVQNGNGAH